jgi:hypothetical protein
MSEYYNNKYVLFGYKNTLLDDYELINTKFILTQSNTLEKITGQYISSTWFNKFFNVKDDYIFYIIICQKDIELSQIKKYFNSYCNNFQISISEILNSDNNIRNMLNNSYINIVNNEISIYSFNITKDSLNNIYNDIINKYINNKYINNENQYTNSKSSILKCISKEDNFLILELSCRIHKDEINNNSTDNNNKLYKNILISTPTFSGYTYIFED